MCAGRWRTPPDEIRRVLRAADKDRKRPPVDPDAERPAAGRDRRAAVIGYRLRRRRVALGYRSHTDLADSLPFTVRTLADIEQGVRKASPGTYAMLENKLAWAPGSIDTILTGGEPKETVVELRRDSPEPRYDSFTSDALSRASTEELLLELRRRIIRPRETWDDWDGLDSRGAAHEELANTQRTGLIRSGRPHCHRCGGSSPQCSASPEGVLSPVVWWQRTLTDYGVVRWGFSRPAV